MTGAGRLRLLVLRNGPLLIFLLTFLVFGLLAHRFLQYRTLEGLVRQSAYVGLIAIGMTFVIVAGLIDLSVGATMYMSIAACDVIVLHGGMPLWLIVPVTVGVGLLGGLLNGLAIARLGVIPFVATLATLAIYRGIGLTLTNAESVIFPHALTAIGTARLGGVLPTPILIFAIAILAGWLVLSRTRFGRHVVAMGENREAAIKAGIAVRRNTVLVFGISGVCSAVAGLVLASQFSVVNADFGRGVEFDAIAAVVIGGASLSGGRGNVFPGTILGVLLVQMVNGGLIFLRVDLYLQPVLFALVIFVAVLLDSQRAHALASLYTRRLRAE